MSTPILHWSAPDDLHRFDPIATRVVADRVVGEVDHFSYGFVTETAEEADAGASDANVTMDAETPDAGDADVEADGGEDAGEDADIDAEADADTSDANPDAKPDASDDGGTPDAGTVVINSPVGSSLHRDACQQRQVQLTSNAGAGAVWSEQLSTGVASIDAAGLITLAPTGYLTSQPDEPWGIAVAGPNGNATMTFFVFLDGVGNYVVSLGGPPIFTGSLPPYSLSGGPYSAQIAAPESAHPCQPEYRSDNRMLAPCDHDAPYDIEIDDQGTVTITGALAEGTYRYCFAAVWMGLALDYSSGTLEVTP